MKIFKSFLVVALIIFCFACGSSSSGSDIPSTETVTLAGTLGLGTVSSSVSKVTTPAANYVVVAIDNATNNTYTANTNTDGTFSLEVPGSTQFHLSLMTGGSYVGPAVFAGSGTEVNTVIKPTTSVDIGSITVDAASGYARSDAQPAIVDTSVTAVASNGKPFGAGPDIDGKDTLSGVTNRTDMDMDTDGIPNMFDADEDNDGIRNGIISRMNVVGTSAIVDRALIASNIWVPHGEVTAGQTHAEYAPTHISMRIMLTPKTGMEDQITSVQCITVPDSIKDIATVNTGSNGNPTDYPPEHALWKDYSYNLYKMITESANSWIAVIAPNTVMNIGDTFTVRATYTDGTTEDFFLTMSYVMTDWAYITEYNGTTLMDSSGSRSSPATVTTSTLAIKFYQPKDEDGNYLEGLTYSVIYGTSTYDPSSGHWQVADPSTWQTIQNSAITDNGDGTMTATVPLSSAGTYYITPVAETADGQRNGEETWFTRS